MAVMLLALLIAGKGWYWNRDAVRMHCPWCRYDFASMVTTLHGQPSLPRCPECGRTAQAIGHLHPRRRNYPVILTGVALLLLAAAIVAALPFRNEAAKQLPRPTLLRIAPWLPPADFSTASWFDLKLQAAAFTDRERDLFVELLAELIRRKDGPSITWALEVIRSQALRRGRIRPGGFESSEQMDAIVFEVGRPISGTIAECGASREARQEVLRYALANLPPDAGLWLCASALAKLGMPSEAVAITLARNIDPQDFGGRGQLEFALSVVREHPTALAQAFDLIGRCLEHENPSVRIGAAVALARLGGIAIPLADRLHRMAREDPDREVQIVASGAERAIREGAKCR